MKHLLFATTLIISGSSFAQDSTSFSLDSYLTNDSILAGQVDSVFNTLDDKAIVAQLLMPAVGRLGSPEDSIDHYVKNGMIGGVLLLNGTKAQFKGWTSKYEAINKKNGMLPFLYSSDAEPSLVNRKMIGSAKVPRANEIKTMDELIRVTKSISNDLNDVGVNYNFAPVVDVNSNKTVGYRGFGANPKNVIPYSDAFIVQTQKQNITLF